MSALIETKNASLDTLAVTIQALHVNGKQMTLAVFRQLPSARAYDDNGKLAAGLEPWGTVRYPIKDEGALWLVASRGGRLYRCRAELDSYYSVERSEAALSEARDTLRAYLDWEPKKVAFDKWYSKPWDERRDEANPGYPESPGYRFEKTGWGKFLAEDVKKAERTVFIARNEWAALDEIMSLPQLFIAV